MESMLLTKPFHHSSVISTSPATACAVELEMKVLMSVCVVEMTSFSSGVQEKNGQTTLGAS